MVLELGGQGQVGAVVFGGDDQAGGVPVDAVDHLAHLGPPLLGDTVYGGKKPVPGLAGQCLHAAQLTGSPRPRCLPQWGHRHQARLTPIKATLGLLSAALLTAFIACAFSLWRCPHCGQLLGVVGPGVHVHGGDIGQAVAEVHGLALRLVPVGVDEH